MAYLRTKTIKGNKYYYLVESKREGSKVNQKVIRYIGRANVMNSLLGNVIDLAK